MAGLQGHRHRQGLSLSTSRHVAMNPPGRHGLQDQIERLETLPEEITAAKEALNAQHV